MNPQILKLALWGVPLKRRIKQKIIFHGIQLPTKKNLTMQLPNNNFDNQSITFFEA